MSFIIVDLDPTHLQSYQNDHTMAMATDSNINFTFVKKGIYFVHNFQ